MTRVRRSLALVAACAALFTGVFVLPGRGAEDAKAIRFAHIPHIANDGRVAFSYHEDLWIADATGANARRLTQHLANDFAPRFSPDGTWIAFTANSRATTTSSSWRRPAANPGSSPSTPATIRRSTGCPTASRS